MDDDDVIYITIDVDEHEFDQWVEVSFTLDKLNDFAQNYYYYPKP